MLEYIKVILVKVAFDRMIFEKELRKGLDLLQPEERLKLKQWCYDNFVDRHLLILESLFAGTSRMSI